MIMEDSKVVLEDGLLLPIPERSVGQVFDLLTDQRPVPPIFID